MNLFELGQGVFAWTHPDPLFGNSNVGLVIDEDGLTVIDTTATPAQADAVRREIESLTAELELPLKRVVLTSSRVAFSGGSGVFWQAGFYGTQSASDQLDTPANPEVFRRLLPHLAPAFDDEFSTRPITHTVEEPAWLTGAAQAIPLAGEAPENLVVRVEAADVVFAGAMASFGVTPLAFDGNPLAWAESLDQLIGLGSTVVPGHGAPGGEGDIADLIGYLLACVEADGEPNRIPAGPWDRWTDRRFDATNVERAAMLDGGDNGVPKAMFELLGMA